MRLWHFVIPILVAIMVSACTSVGNLGIVTRPTVDGGALLKSGRSFQELGFCRRECLPAFHSRYHSFR